MTDSANHPSDIIGPLPVATNNDIPAGASTRSGDGGAKIKLRNAKNDTKWSLFSSIATVVGSIATTVGVIIALVVYLGTIQQNRVAASLAFALNYMDGEILESRRALRKLISDDILDLADVQGGREFLRKDVAALVRDPDNGAVDALITTVNYFDAAARCVQARVCDQRALASQLKSDAVSLQCYFGRAIYELRVERGYLGIGEGLRTIGGDSDCAISAR